MAYLSLRSLIPSLALASVAFSSSAQAAGEPCFRDTECAGAELCLDGTCNQPASALPSCSGDAECDDVCNDGFCKFEGIVCRNPAGECWVESSAGQCLCADGNGSGWSDGFNPDDPPEMKTDAQIQEGCGVALVDACGSEAPSLPESCQGEVLTDCEAYVAHVDGLADLCGEQVPDVNIARVGACCESQNDLYYVDYRACVLAIGDVTGCPGEALEACEGEGGSPEGDTDDNAGTAADGATSGGEAADDDDSKGGCNIAGEGLPASLLLLVGFGLLSRRRHI